MCPLYEVLGGFRKASHRWSSYVRERHPRSKIRLSCNDPGDVLAALLNTLDIQGPSRCQIHIYVSFRAVGMSDAYDKFVSRRLEDKSRCSAACSGAPTYGGSDGRQHLKGGTFSAIVFQEKSEPAGRA